MTIAVALILNDLLTTSSQLSDHQSEAAVVKELADSTAQLALESILSHKAHTTVAMLSGTEDLEHAFDRLAETTRSEKDRTNSDAAHLILELQPVISVLRAESVLLATQIRAGQIDQARKFYAQRMSYHLLRVRELVGDFHGAIASSRSALQSRASSTLVITIVLAIAAVVSILLAGGYSAKRIAQRITQPITNLSDALGKLDTDHLEEWVEEPEELELRNVAVQFNRTVARLRASETERTKSVEQLTQARATQEKLADEAKSANKAKSMFLANMSHEIRTPMTAILGYADLLLEPNQRDEDRLQHIQTIRDNGVHLLASPNDILDVPKTEPRKLETVETRDSPWKLPETVGS